MRAAERTGEGRGRDPRSHPHPFPSPMRSRGGSSCRSPGAVVCDSPGRVQRSPGHVAWLELSHRLYPFFLNAAGRKQDGDCRCGLRAAPDGHIWEDRGCICHHPDTCDRRHVPGDVRGHHCRGDFQSPGEERHPWESSSIASPERSPWDGDEWNRLGTGRRRESSSPSKCTGPKWREEVTRNIQTSENQSCIRLDWIIQTTQLPGSRGSWDLTESLCPLNPTSPSILQ